MTFRKDPNVLVAGPGALGAYFAARLGRRFPGVRVLARDPSRAVELEERGFRVSGADPTDWTPPPGHVRAVARGWPVMDIILFLVKTPSLAAAARQAWAVTGPRTVWVVPQETPAPFPPAVRKAGRRIVRALITVMARSEGPGRAAQEAAGETILDGAAPFARDAAAVFRDAGLSARLSKDWEAERWRAFLVRVCTEAPAAAADAPYGRLLEPPLDRMAEKLAEECAALSAALRRPLPPGELPRRAREACLRAPSAGTPMGRDLLRGRPTERAALLDPLLTPGAKSRAPTLALVDRLLRRLEKAGG